MADYFEIVRPQIEKATTLLSALAFSVIRLWGEDSEAEKARKETLITKVNSVKAILDDVEIDLSNQTIPFEKLDELIERSKSVRTSVTTNDELVSAFQLKQARLLTIMLIRAKRRLQKS